MRIVDFDLYTVPPRWLFLRLRTDTGLEGWGEPIVEGREQTTRAAVTELIEEYLIGKDPLPVERHWQYMYRSAHHRGGPILMSAISGIDQALWDLKGKHMNAPVYELLGGPVRDRIAVSQWVSGDKPDDLADSAKYAVENGFESIELMMNAGPANTRTRKILLNAKNRLDSCMDVIPEHVDVGVDIRGRVGLGVAKSLVSELSSYNLTFVEEPVLPEHQNALSEIASVSSNPIATGQRLYTKEEFRILLERQPVDYVQPALAHAGGITEVMKIADLASSYGVRVLPKSPVGPISFAACLQLSLANQNVVQQEQHDELHSKPDSEFFSYVANDDYFQWEDGFLSVTDAPGLGITIDTETVQTMAGESIHWRSPTWHHDDGSVADW
ncbi:galactonate dehydratase [Halorubrum sp. DTA98]|uniref:galactonate dehydratase n=1 Tax=Halorubrum sp. DTA98 TaxID=3402163 RepID=UPI003AAB3A62